VTYGFDDIGENTAELVQHIDVTTTLANVVGCESDQFQGIDLREGTRAYCLSQRGTASLGPYYEHGSDFREELFHEAPVDALRSKEYKFVRSAERAELFRLPDEETDVADTNERESDRLGNELDQLLTNVSRCREASETTEFTDEMKQQLSDLGYL